MSWKESMMRMFTENRPKTTKAAAEGSVPTKQELLEELYSWVMHYENEIELLQTEIVILEAEINGEV